MFFVHRLTFYYSLLVYPVGAAKILVLAKNENWIINIWNKNKEID